MAGPWTYVLATWKQVSTDLPAAPSILVVSFDAAFGRRILPAEAILSRTHGRAGWTGPGMTGLVAGMRTSLAGPGASLATRMGRQARQRSRVDFLLAPACIRRWTNILGQVATGTTPLPRRGVVISLALLLVLEDGPLVLRPLFDAAQMEDGPAEPARPHAGPAPELAGADGAFIKAVGDVFMYAGGEIGGS